MAPVYTNSHLTLLCLLAAKTILKLARDRIPKERHEPKTNDNTSNEIATNDILSIFAFNRGISVYNICLINISDTVSGQATKISIMNIERAKHNCLSQGI
jgi:hypothetical protein